MLLHQHHRLPAVNTQKFVTFGQCSQCSYTNLRLKSCWLSLQAAEQHAEFTKEDGHHYVNDLGTPAGTWLNDKRMEAGAKKRLRPGDVLEFGQPGTGLRYKIKVSGVQPAAQCQHGARAAA